MSDWYSPTTLFLGEWFSDIEPVTRRLGVANGRIYITQEYRDWKRFFDTDVS